MSVTIEFPWIKAEGAAEGGELRACRGCLATDLPLFDLSSQGLSKIYSELTGFPVLPTDTYPQHMCVMCKHLLSKFFEFRLRCHSAMYVIQQMVEGGIKVSTESLRTVDKSNLKINLLATDAQVMSLEDSETASANHFDKISNTSPANAVNNIDLKNEDSENDLYLFVDGRKDEKINITAAEIVNSVDNDNNVSSALSQNDEWLSDTELNNSKLQTKRKRVNKENVTCKRPSKRPARKETKGTIKIEYEEQDEKLDVTGLGDAHKNVKFVSNKSDKSQSDTKFESSKLPTKRKRVYKENVTRKRRRKTKIAAGKEIEGRLLNEGADEKQDVINIMSSIMRSAWKEYRGSYASLWEEVHQESLKENEPLDYKDFSHWTLTQKINQYLYLSKKLATLYNCELKFSCLADLKKEIEDRKSSEMYQNARFKCEICFKHYNFEETYKRHMVSHDPKTGDVVCEACLYRFKDRSQYMTHYLRYHSKAIVCKTCGVINREWRDAVKHFKWHGGAAIECELCGKHYSNRKQFLMHRMQVHKTEFGTTLCLLCGDVFNGATGLKMHMRAHIECAHCPACDTRFASEDALAVHTAHSRQGCPTLSACPVCGHNFPSEPSMREHYDQLHKKEVECEQIRRRKACQRETNAGKRGRQRGTATGTRGRPKGTAIGTRGRQSGTATMSEPKQVYMCELCGQGNFKCPALLRYHQRIHTGERPYQCGLCHKSFRLSLLLKKHMDTHTDARPYKCPHCPKAFRQMAHRTAHVRSHTKEQPYKCDICSKRYAHLPSLNEHIDTAHKGLPPKKKKNKDMTCKNK